MLCLVFVRPQAMQNDEVLMGKDETHQTKWHRQTKGCLLKQPGPL